VNDIRASFAGQGLVRPRDGRVLAGVVAGLGRRFGLDPWPARLVFVLLLMVIPGSQLLIYPLLWILMPSEDRLVGAAHGGPVGPMPPAPPMPHPPQAARPPQPTPPATA
jgi:phage shock protein PspC (stress-responsive transcriptional regulator)